MKKTAFVILATAILANAALFYYKPLGENFFIIADLVVMGLSLTAFIFGFLSYRMHGLKSIQGKALLFLSLGVLFWFFGESIWAYYEIVLGIEAPIASFADLAWLVGYPLFAAGLFCEWKITRMPLTANRKTAMLLLIIVAFCIAGWFGIAPTIASNEMGLTEKTVMVLYVIGDLLLIIGCMAVMISFYGSIFARQWSILTAAIIVSGVADILYAYLSVSYTTGSWIDLLWNIDYMLMAFGFFYYRQSIKEKLTKETELAK